MVFCLPYDGKPLCTRMQHPVSRSVGENKQVARLHWFDRALNEILKKIKIRP